MKESLLLLKKAEENLPLVRAALAVGIIEPSVLDGKSYFLPDEPVTREEAAHIMGALSNAVIATSKPEAFSDLDEADDEYIENLKKEIINVLTNTDWKKELNSTAMCRIKQYHIVDILKKYIKDIK